jgi:cytochrome c biogenesis protein CcmG, thiol:disulfide interchange protein DsbE
VRKHGWRFPILEDHDGAVGNRYQLAGLPTTFLLDAKGRIVKQLTGPQTAAGLIASVRALRS